MTLTIQEEAFHNTVEKKRNVKKSTNHFCRHLLNGAKPLVGTRWSMIPIAIKEQGEKATEEFIQNRIIVKIDATKRSKTNYKTSLTLFLA